MHPTLKRLTGTIGSLLGAVVLFSLLSIGAYWIYAFLYYGGHGDLAGAPAWAVGHLHPGPLVWSDWASVSYHVLAFCGPGIFVLIPSYLILRLYETFVPR